MCTWHSNYFLLPPPKMGRSPRDNNFAILARIVWAWCPHAALMNPVMKGTTYIQFVKNSKFLQQIDVDELDTSPQNAFWWGQRSHWLSELMCGPCNWSNCPSHVRTVEINQDVENTPIVTIPLLEWNIWVWCNYTTIYQFDWLPFTTKWSTRGAFSVSNISWGSWNENTPNDKC